MMDNFINYQELEEQANLGAFSQYDMRAIVPDLIKLKKDNLYVEIGTDKGRSLSIAKKVTNPNIRLYGIDINKQAEIERILDNRTKFIWADSVFAAKVWSCFEGLIDVLFIDGDHSYDGCKRDIKAWHRHMATNGIMFFHDYDISSPGVIQAVDEFIKANNLHLEICKETCGNTSIVKVQL